MLKFTKHYINGQFVESLGTETFDLINPASGKLRGQVTLGDERDAALAIKAAKEAFKSFSKTSLEERAALLDRLAEAYAERREEHAQALIEEYGGTASMAKFSVDRAINLFKVVKESMFKMHYSSKIGEVLVLKEAVGVAGLITP